VTSLLELSGVFLAFRVWGNYTSIKSFYSSNSSARNTPAKALALQINPCLHRVIAWSLYTLPRIDIRLPISDHICGGPLRVGPDVTYCERFGSFLGCGGWETEAKEEVEIGHSQRRDFMLWTIFVILLVLWLLGLVSSYTLGGFIHILLVLAVVVLIINLLSGRSTAV
jgi:hypothetical protein